MAAPSAPPSSAAASPWRRTAGPPQWKAYATLVAVASTPFFVRGFVVLAGEPAPTGFLAALWLLLIAANACILELPPHRFLHFTAGLIAFAGFFVVGPAILALLLLAIPPSHLLLTLLRALPRASRREPPLGGAFPEYVVPLSALAIALGVLDRIVRDLGFVYPFAPNAPGSEALALLFLAGVYLAILLLTEIGVCLRFGWHAALGSPRARADLFVHALAVLIGAPVAPAMARVYVPDPAHMLFALGWALWAFGVFAVAAVLVRRQRAVARLSRTVARQERLAALGGLASVIAHQTRHHLGILHMSAYVIGETLARERLSDRARETVSNELEAIARTRTELYDLLTQELSGGELAEAFDLSALTRDVVFDLEPLARERQASLTIETLPTLVRGDRLRLKQAFANVLRNAIEAAPRGSRVEITTRPLGRIARLTVRDHGAGLSPSAREHLFEPLYSEKRDGLGIGLSVSRAIVEAHGGELAIDDASPGVRAEIRLAMDEDPRGGEPG